jgi:pimeloyl-ACP methyl ester carboxylesterase
VLLLHGLLGTPEHWATTLEALAPRWRGMALALPVFELPADDLTVSRLASHVRDFLDAQRVGPVVIVANSLGGHVALELALRDPARLRALVLTGSGGLLERTFTRGVPHRPNAGFVRAKMEEIFYDTSLVTREWVESTQALIGQRSYALRLLQISRSARRESVENRLGDIRCPCLLVWGKEDRITPPEIGLRFLAAIARSEIRFIPNCGHAAMLEQPAAFNDHLTEFLDGLSVLPAPRREGSPV